MHHDIGAEIAETRHRRAPGGIAGVGGAPSATTTMAASGSTPMQPRSERGITPRCRFVEREQIDIRRKLRRVDLFERRAVGHGGAADRDANGVVARAHFGGGDLQREPREARRLTIERHLENRQRRCRAARAGRAAHPASVRTSSCVSGAGKHSHTGVRRRLERCESRIERGVKASACLTARRTGDWNRQRIRPRRAAAAPRLRARRRSRGAARRLAGGSAPRGNGRDTATQQNGRRPKVNHGTNAIPRVWSETGAMSPMRPNAALQVRRAADPESRSAESSGRSAIAPGGEPEGDSGRAPRDGR